MTPHYVVVDVERIQEFIFASRRLKDIRGASQLLIEAEAEIQSARDVVYASGGVALAKCSDRVAALAFARRAANTYREKTGGAVSVVSAVSPVAEGHSGLQRRLRHAKEERREGAGQGEATEATPGALGFPSTTLGHLPYLRLCNECGTRAAGPLWRASDVLLCEVCARRRDAGAGEAPQEERLLRSLSPRPELPRDFNDFGEAFQTQPAREKRFMAVLAADGNGFGDHIEKLTHDTNPDEALRRFSESVTAALERSLHDAVRHSFEDVLMRQGSEARLPLRILLAGGDDLLVVVEASRAFELAWSVARNFEAHTGHMAAELGLSEGESLTLSVGVAFAKVNHPFSQIYDFAHRQLARAKRPVGTEVGGRPGASRPEARVNAGVIRSSVLDADRETGALGVPSPRPWSLDELSRLNRAWQEYASEVPRSKLKALASAMRADLSAPREGAEPDPMECTLWRNSLRPDQRAAFDKILVELGLSATSFWRRDATGQPVSPLADWLEFMDFLRP